MDRETFGEKTSLIKEAFVRYKKPMIYGFLTLVAVDLLEIVPPLILKNAVDGIVEQKPYSQLLWFAVAYLSVALLQGLCRYGWRIFLIRSSHLAGRDLRGQFAEHLFRLPASFYDKNRVGELISHVNSDVESVRMFIGPGLLTLADAVFYILIVPVAMFVLSPKLTLLALAPLPIIPFLVLYFENQIHTRYKKSQEHFSVLAAMAQENLGGIRVTKAFALEDKQLDRFKVLGENYIDLNMRLARIQTAFGPWMDFFTSMGMVLLIWWGGKSVISDAVSLGTFVAFQRYIQKMVWPMIAIGFSLSHFQRAIASSDRLKSILKTDPEIKNNPKPGPFKLKGKIEIKNLSFNFKNSSQTLKNISLTIEPEARVAFVGGIGSGKSTLLHLIPRLYPAPQQSIFVDGHAIEDWDLEELRSQIGFVSQEVFLFSDNVFENVSFGLKNQSSQQMNQKVYESTLMAHVRDDIDRLPKGFNTQLGERGVNLSGGQKQRVSIARALAKDPKILIFDDSLSAVDVKTESILLESLRKRAPKNTELIAAHRISTIQDADHIFVMERGEIIAQGKHQQLIQNKNSIYFRFYEQQRLKEDLEAYLEKIDR